MNSTPDRPPLLRFLVMFAILLAGATGLAALSHSVPEDVDAPSTATEGRVVPAPAAEHKTDPRGVLGQP